MHECDILIPSTYWIYIWKLCNWILDNWTALVAVIRIELTHHRVISVSIFVVADTRTHICKPFMRPRRIIRPPSLILSVFPISSQSSPQRPLLSREVDLESLGGTEVEGPWPGSRCSAGLQVYIIRLRPTKHDT